MRKTYYQLYTANVNIPRCYSMTIFTKKREARKYIPKFLENIGQYYTEDDIRIAKIKLFSKCP